MAGMKVSLPLAWVHRTASSVDRFEPTRPEPGPAFAQALDRYQHRDSGRGNPSQGAYYLDSFGPVAGASYSLDAVEVHSRERAPKFHEEDIEDALKALRGAQPAELPTRAIRAAAGMLHRETLPQSSRGQLRTALEEWREQGLCSFESLDPPPGQRLELHGTTLLHAPIPAAPIPAFDARIAEYEKLGRDDPLPATFSREVDPLMKELLNRVEQKPEHRRLDPMRALRNIVERADPSLLRPHLPRMTELSSRVLADHGTPAAGSVMRFYETLCEKFPDTPTSEFWHRQLIPMVTEDGGKLPYFAIDQLRKDPELGQEIATAVLDHPERRRVFSKFSEVVVRAVEEGLKLNSSHLDEMVGGLLGNDATDCLKVLNAVGKADLGGYKVGDKLLTHHLFEKRYQSRDLDGYWSENVGRDYLRLIFPDSGLTAGMLKELKSHLNQAESLWKLEPECEKALATLGALQREGLLAEDQEKELAELTRPLAYGNESPSSAEKSLQSLRRWHLSTELQQRLAGEEAPLDVWVDMMARFTDGHYRPQSGWFFQQYQDSLRNSSELVVQGQKAGLTQKVLAYFQSGEKTPTQADIARIWLLAAHEDKKNPSALAGKMALPLSKKVEGSLKYDAARSAWREMVQSYLREAQYRGDIDQRLETTEAIAHWETREFGWEQRAALEKLKSGEVRGREAIDLALQFLEPLTPTNSMVVEYWAEGTSAAVLDHLGRLTQASDYVKLQGEVLQLLGSKSLGELSAKELCKLWALSSAPSEELLAPVMTRLPLRSPGGVRGMKRWRQVALKQVMAAPDLPSLEKSRQGLPLIFSSYPRDLGEQLDHLSSQIEAPTESTAVHLRDALLPRLQNLTSLRQLPMRDAADLWFTLEKGPQDLSFVQSLVEALGPLLPAPTDERIWNHELFGHKLREIATQKLAASSQNEGLLADVRRARMILALEPEAATTGALLDGVERQMREQQYDWYEALPLAAGQKLVGAETILSEGHGSVNERGEILLDLWERFGGPQQIGDPIQVFRHVNQLLKAGEPREQAIETALRDFLGDSDHQVEELKFEDDLVVIGDFALEVG